jgi:3-oxoadipyl-CoA thiolase
MTKTAYVVDILRTPVGKYAGALSTVRPDDLAAHAIKKLLQRNISIDPLSVEDVIFGAANQSGEDNRNVARMALLLAGLPAKTGGVTVNRLCASGLQAIMDASRAVMCNEGSIYIAGGVESMSRAPFVMPKAETSFDRKAEIFDTTLGWRFVNSKLSALYHPFSMGETAENVAEKWKISRDMQDAFALESQIKYRNASAAGKFIDEIVAVSVPKVKGDAVEFSTDEQPRADTTIEKLATLKAAFRTGGTVTAGNSSGINDGAAASLIASEEYIKKNNVRPLARVVSMAVAGVDPAYMGVGPVPAVQKAIQRAGLKLTDMGLIELNEAFAAQVLACIQDLKIDPQIINVNGGSIAIGHPLGCSGVRISATLIHEMNRRKVKYGIATMCVGVGQGAAIIYENTNL